MPFVARAHVGPVGSSRDRDWILLLLPVAIVSLFVVFVLATHDVSIVEGVSMRPTLRTADRLLLTRGYEHANRQDIIVFDPGEGYQTTLVKRVVGVPGDTVLVLGDRVLVNGIPEPPHRMVVTPSDHTDALMLTVPKGHVYVMGDNRPQALDSRLLGPVKISAVKGRVVAILAPLGRVRYISAAASP